VRKLIAPNSGFSISGESRSGSRDPADFSFFDKGLVCAALEKKERANRRAHERRRPKRPPGQAAKELRHGVHFWHQHPHYA
jgi:hypothetical protein